MKTMIKGYHWLEENWIGTRVPAWMTPRDRAGASSDSDQQNAYGKVAERHV